jgi:hypothetical protein
MDLGVVLAKEPQVIQAAVKQKRAKTDHVGAAAGHLNFVSMRRESDLHHEREI